MKTESFEQLSARLPMVIDMSSGFHFRPEGSAFSAWRFPPDETRGFRTDFDFGFIEKILTRAVNRVARVDEVEVNPRRCWAGMYEMTPIITQSSALLRVLKGCILANGFSGHGVMHSPATGKIVSEMILNGKSSFADAPMLPSERFAEGHLLEETAVL